ncbi:hypothetical protein BWK59_05255 [Flavobacterium davisii]|uniref:Uncharacterized protein n=1 Tax=Flavobacterium davisii TaxID=2906077 RepID=A0A246GJW0_9FLAO|nr:hypothetical protein [Flavobacterium davisii]OWP84468.1 hypothetical protein BWK59_05255 [Flavobacterium davisii]
MKKYIYLVLIALYCSCKKDNDTTNKFCYSNSENLNNIYSKDSLVVENDSVQGILMLNEFYSKFYFDDNIKIDN